MVFLREVARLGPGHKDTHSMETQRKFSVISLEGIIHSKVCFITIWAWRRNPVCIKFLTPKI